MFGLDLPWWELIARGAIVGPDTTLVDCEVGAGASNHRCGVFVSWRLGACAL